MFIFKPKKKPSSPSDKKKCSNSPQKSLETAFARALALENLLVAGYKNSKEGPKLTEKKYFKMLRSSKLKFSDKITVRQTQIFHTLLSHNNLSHNIKLLEIFFQ